MSKPKIVGIVPGLRATADYIVLSWPMDLPCKHTRKIEGCEHCMFYAETHPEQVKRPHD